MISYTRARKEDSLTLVRDAGQEEAPRCCYRLYVDDGEHYSIPLSRKELEWLLVVIPQIISSREGQ